MRIVVVGGGIGGQALALSLHDAGFDDIVVLEAASQVRELGVGINILPHAVRELDELGLLADLDDVAVRTAELVYHNRFGQRIWAEPRGIAAGYRWPQFSINRGELLGALYRHVIDRLGPHVVRTGRSVCSVRPAHSGASPAVELVDGEIIEGDVVIGCDGVHSVVRATLHPTAGLPRWNGVTMWRGTTWSEPFLSGATMIMAGVLSHRVVVYPIHRNGDRVLINWVAEVRTDDGRPMPRQDWDHRVDRAEVVAHFADFTFDWLDVPELIRRADDVYQYPMVDLDPLDHWGASGVTLLGDAAHPMYPIGSNGASQAIIDARVLARSLALEADVDAALAAYEGERRPATAKVVLANREVGPELSMELVAERAPEGFARLDDVISHDELVEISTRYRRLAGFDPEVLNRRPSLSVRPHG
jgi:2-polyprenyl-6-methoxyphenol hydroxylase-like FAD-dependent oxidoreductase